MSPSVQVASPIVIGSGRRWPSTSILIVRSRCSARLATISPRGPSAPGSSTISSRGARAPDLVEHPQLSPQRLCEVGERLLGELVPVALHDRVEVLDHHEQAAQGAEVAFGPGHLLGQALGQRRRCEPAGASRPGGSVRALGSLAAIRVAVESRFGPGIRSPAPHGIMNPAAPRGKG